MKIALVHDYIKEYGGAERVLKTLTEMFPEAPIYTAFKVNGSVAGTEFRNSNIVESFLAPILKIGNLYSPLRFLAPLIWGSFDLSGYDLVITSCSWYITRGFKVGPNTCVIAYCHTPPRWLYGFETSVGFTKYWPVRIYSKIVGYFMKKYDFNTAQEIDNWVANSINVAERIKKFYGKDSTIIYPPVDVEKIAKSTKSTQKGKYYLIVSRLVGAKGLEEAVQAAVNLGIELKIIGQSTGFSAVENKLKQNANEKITLVGRVSDKVLFKSLGQAKGFIALAKDEDFGMTVVEAQAAGTPVIAFNGGGFRESVIDGKTGIFINEVSTAAIKKAIDQLEKTVWKREVLVANARKFSKERFVHKMLQFINEHCQTKIDQSRGK